MNALDVSQAAARSTLEPLERLVLIMMGRYTNAEGRCWPSLATLCRDTGLSKAAMCRKISRLAELGWITWARSKGRRRSTYVVVLRPQLPFPAEQVQPDRKTTVSAVDSSTVSPEDSSTSQLSLSDHANCLSQRPQLSPGETVHDLKYSMELLHGTAAAAGTPPTVSAGDSSLKPDAVRCPPDLRLTEDQLTALEMGGIARSDANRLAVPVVGKFVTDARPKPMSVWQRMLVVAVEGNARGKQSASGSNGQRPGRKPPLQPYRGGDVFADRERRIAARKVKKP